ncbi:MAG: hypothetical protein N2688_00085 [Burkholderiaceae bacterium]|nr:hypothetical protein [Burkholderiaceae bacterium]
MTSEKLAALARGVAQRQHSATPIFMRALAECLRQHAADVAQLEAAVLGPAATAPRTGNVVALPLSKRLPVEPRFPNKDPAA